MEIIVVVVVAGVVAGVVAEVGVCLFKLESKIKIRTSYKC